MSDQPIDVALDMRRELARIDRDLAETQKLNAETRKLFAEARKFDYAEFEKLSAETRKLFSEAAKLDRDRWLAPWLAIAGLLGGIITVAGALWRALGH